MKIYSTRVVHPPQQAHGPYKVLQGLMRLRVTSPQAVLFLMFPVELDSLSMRRHLHLIQVDTAFARVVLSLLTGERQLIRQMVTQTVMSPYLKSKFIIAIFFKYLIKFLHTTASPIETQQTPTSPTATPNQLPLFYDDLKSNLQV